MHDLNVCWNTVYRSVFNFNHWESVKGFITGLGKLSLWYILKVHKVKFYYHLLISACITLLTVNINIAVSSIYEQFSVIIRFRY